MDLLLLAADIQEEILFLEVAPGTQPPPPTQVPHEQSAWQVCVPPTPHGCVAPL